MTDIIQTLDYLIPLAVKYERGASDYPAYPTAGTLKAVKEEITRLRSELEQAKDYVAKALASFEADPADNRFLKGFQAALEVVRDEAFSSPVASTELP